MTAMYTAVAVYPSRLDGVAPYPKHLGANPGLPIMMPLLFAIGPDPGPAIRIVEPIT
jgi:hypothetical protein